MSRIKGLVLLHGRGGTAASLRPLLAPLGAEGLALAGPEAPGHSWWPTSFLAPSAQMEPYVAQGLAAVEDAVGTLGLPRAEIGLLGFSQGGCLALEYAARQGAGLGAVIAFSAGLVGTSDAGAPSEALFGAADKAFTYGTDLSGTRIVLTCHAQDPHIPLKRAKDSATALATLGAGVDSVWHDGPGHQPEADGLAAAQRVL